MIDSTPSSAPAESWQSWGVEEWGERLLEHFFARRPGGSQADVSSLPACGEELARVAGNPPANAVQVRGRFVAAVIEASVPAGGLLEHALQGWSPLEPEKRPPVLAHLYVTCLAASENAVDGNHGKDEFIGPLGILCSGHVGSLENLPKLWERLREWLNAGRNPRHYRGLSLPDPAAWRRVGYSVRIAFPCRHDRNELATVLGVAGLSDGDPPVARVITAVAAERRRFRRTFIEAFDDFRALWEAAGRNDPNLLEHRFWLAARSVSGDSDMGGGSGTRMGAVAVIGYEFDDALIPLLVSTGPRLIQAPFASVALEFQIGEYTHGIVFDADASSGRFEEASRRALGGTSPAWAPAGVRQGLVLFMEGRMGYMESAERDQLAAATVALVRDDLAKEFRTRFGHTRTKQKPARVPGWQEFRDFAVTTLPASALEQSPLARCGILYETFERPRIRISKGIRCDDGYLGIPEHLPEIAIDAVDAVTFQFGEAATVDLVRSNGTKWTFPVQGLTASGVLVASLNGRIVDQRAITFHREPASEQPRRPTQPADWFTEGVRGTTIFSELSGAGPGRDLASWLRTTAYLGANVGQFTSDGNDAVWLVRRSGAQKVVTRTANHADGGVPSYQAKDAGLARKWRKWVFNSDPFDQNTFQARRMIRSVANGDLPAQDLTIQPPDLNYSPIVQREAAEVDEVIAVLSGRCSTRTGIPDYEWYSYLRLLNAGDAISTLEPIVRAWTEACLLDHLWHSRWRRPVVFARKPSFVVFEEAGSFHATLTGLTLRSTRKAVEDEARRRGVACANIGSLSRYVPSTVRISADSSRTLQDLATAVRIPTEFLEADLDRLAAVRNLDIGSAPITGYGVGSPISDWAVGRAAPAGVSVHRYTRNDRPDIWVAERGEERLWSYSFNNARLAACRLAGVAPLAARGSNEFDAAVAYLPLPFARILGVIASARSGPKDSLAYAYSSPTATLRAELLAATSPIVN
ncbi:MAG TPA: hypothetical protein VL200_06280 [Lacunisphaera sp.]|nr:hypothetical protein [Lacunisphaera sp.]